MNERATAGEASKNLDTLPGDIRIGHSRKRLPILYRAKDDEQLEDTGIMSSSGELSFFC